MKYIIVVDKQPRSNPSAEKRETIIDIEELRRKGDVHDDFTIEQGIAKVYRRIGLTKTHVTYVLENEVIEELGELKVKLFKGDNYIYIKDEYNNNMCAEFVIDNEFNDRYVTNLQMSSAINQTARQIDLSVNQKLEGYYTKEETEASIKLTAESIKSEVKGIKEEAIKNVDVKYALSNSETTAPSTGWSTIAPQWQDGKYMWQKTITTLADDTVKESEPTCISGAKGQKGDQGIQGLQGEKGEQGIPGADGTSGKTSYFHIKYSSVANPTSAQMSETPNTYIGTYVDFTEADSTDPSKYTWTRFQGLQGAKGEQGIPGTNGVNGISYYLHIKYSNDGKTFTANNGETVGDYIGIRTDTNQNDSNVFSDYKWSKIKGTGAKKITEQYYLSTSKTTQTGGTWKTTPDKWVTGHYMWTRSELLWSDNTVTYTEPILSVNTNEMYSQIVQLKNEVGIKLSAEDFTAAQILLKINEDTSEAKIGADKIDITATNILNILANNAINLTTGNIIISSTNFSVDKYGNIIAKSGKIAGFTINNNTLAGGQVGICGLDGENYAFWAGSNNSLDAPFRVGHSGEVFADNITITGGNVSLVSSKGYCNFEIKNNDGISNFFGDALNIAESIGNSIPAQIEIYVINGEAKIDLLNRDISSNTEITGSGITIGGRSVQSCENLYNNAYGTSGTVTLSESSANYAYIDITYAYGSVKTERVYNPSRQTSMPRTRTL